MNNLCNGTKFPRFTFSRHIPIMVGNVNPNDYPNDRTLAVAPVGTLLIINELYDPETCTVSCACGLFQKCSTGPHCAGSQWTEINPITPCAEMDAQTCDDEQPAPMMAVEHCTDGATVEQGTEITNEMVETVTE